MLFTFVVCSLTHVHEVLIRDPMRRPWRRGDVIVIFICPIGAVGLVECLSMIMNDNGDSDRKNNTKVKEVEMCIYPHNRPKRPTGLWVVENATLFTQ
jgi:hypothetical protein